MTVCGCSQIWRKTSSGGKWKRQERHLHIHRRRNLCSPSLPDTKNHREPEIEAQRETRDSWMQHQWNIRELIYKERPLLMQAVSKRSQPEVCGQDAYFKLCCWLGVIFFSSLGNCSPKWKWGLLKAVVTGEKMLLYVTWLVFGEGGMPFRGRMTCEKELSSFLD